METALGRYGRKMAAYAEGGRVPGANERQAYTVTRTV